jgi:integrase
MRRARQSDRGLEQAIKRAKLSELRVYDLRHTYASLLLSAGAPITYLSAQLGHATPTTTLRYYAKWIPSQGRRWVEVLDQADITASRKRSKNLVSRQGLEPWTP